MCDVIVWGGGPNAGTPQRARLSEWLGLSREFAIIQCANKVLFRLIFGQQLGHR